jgi:hypothetical protein
VYLCQTAAHFVSHLFEPSIRFTGRGSIQLREACVETHFFTKQVIPPHVSLENRIESGGIVANNLHIHRQKILE